MYICIYIYIHMHIHIHIYIYIHIIYTYILRYSFTRIPADIDRRARCSIVWCQVSAPTYDFSSAGMSHISSEWATTLRTTSCRLSRCHLPSNSVRYLQQYMTLVGQIIFREKETERKREWARVRVRARARAIARVRTRARAKARANKSKRDNAKEQTRQDKRKESCAMSLSCEEHDKDNINGKSTI